MRNFLCALALCCLLAACQTTQTFPAPDDSRGTVNLSSALYLPEGQGPFPALIGMHGCNGLHSNHTTWARRLNEWGYAVLLVDGLNPRNIDTLCRGEWPLPAKQRAIDAFAAREFLRKNPTISADRIGIIGWSHGGETVLYALDYSQSKFERRDDPFKVGIAIYPPCVFKRTFFGVDSPLLILKGADDSAGSPIGDMCPGMVQRAGTSRELIDFVSYPGVVHGYDNPGVNRSTEWGWVIRYDAEAAADTYRRVRTFLEANL